MRRSVTEASRSTGTTLSGSGVRGNYLRCFLFSLLMGGFQRGAVPPLAEILSILGGMTEPAMVVRKAYDWTLWILPKVEKFPRSYRFSAGDNL